MRWPFRLSAHASGDPPGGERDATAVAVNELVGKATGSDAAPRLASPVGIAAAYWSRAFAAAVVEPPALADLLPAVVVRLTLEGYWIHTS